MKFPSGDPDLQRVREVFGTYLWRVSGRCLRRYLPGRRIHGTEFSKMAFLPPPHSAVRSSPWTSVEKKKKKNTVLCFSDGFGPNFCENTTDFSRGNFMGFQTTKFLSECDWNKRKWLRFRCCLKALNVLYIRHHFRWSILGLK